MGRCLASFPEAVFQTQGWLVMGPQGCPGGLTGDFGFHSPPPLLWTSCSFLSTHKRHLPTYLLIPPCLLSRTHQRPCLLKVKKGEKRKEKFCFRLYFNFLTKTFKILLLIKMIPLFLKSLWYWHSHYVFLRKVTGLSQQWTWSSAAWTSSKCAMKWPEMSLGWDISEINRRPRCFKEVSFSCPFHGGKGEFICHCQPGMNCLVKDSLAERTRDYFYIMCEHASLPGSPELTVCFNDYLLTAF